MEPAFFNKLFISVDFHFFAKSLVLASLGSFDFLIKLIMGSMFDNAIVNPSRI